MPHTSYTLRLKATEEQFEWTIATEYTNDSDLIVYELIELSNACRRSTSRTLVESVTSNPETLLNALWIRHPRRRLVLMLSSEYGHRCRTDRRRLINRRHRKRRALAARRVVKLEHPAPVLRRRRNRDHFRPLFHGGIQQTNVEYADVCLTVWTQ